ncbi:hypothetical protein KUTeg_018471 [Tegillarca granosa]|uniref:Uncharacterized protein n=1 Tax=Tegillarca granosa TaxID=220873 RepID=A0ABQ9ENR2_TEGGR|nr:hypothetical protein KUTeg_018471 [Tegillarca granosa]
MKYIFYNLYKTENLYIFDFNRKEKSLNLKIENGHFKFLFIYILQKFLLFYFRKYQKITI